MFINYLKTTIRNLFKSGFHVITNVLGLGIGIAMCILAFFLNAYNSEFNHCYSKTEMSKIYRLDYTTYQNDEKVTFGRTNMAHTYFIDNEIPGVESVIRFAGRPVTVKSDFNRFGEYMNFMSPSFFESFPIELVKGSLSEFNQPESIYLNEKLAQKFFPDESPVGKPISILVKDLGGITDFIVKGVFKEGIDNSSFGYIMLITNFDNLYRISEANKYDIQSGVQSAIFIKAKNPEVITNPKLLSKLDEFAKNDDPESKDAYSFTPFTETWKDNDIQSTYENEEINKETLRIFELIGVFILLIGCFNYTIFALSMANKRLKEIGLRKVSGGNRLQIMIQFMTESVLLCLTATLTGLLISQLLVPVIADFWGGFDFGLSDISLSRIIIFLVSITLFMALIAGFYPAIYITRYKPVEILTKTTKLKKSSWVTYSLVFMQQAITILGLGAALIFTRNIYWQENMDLGFEKNNLLTIQGLNATDKRDIFIELAKKHPKVVSAGISWKMLGNGTGDKAITFKGQEYYLDLMETGPNYLETNGVKLKYGRFWRNDSESDMKMNALVNEEFVKVTGVENPIGEIITLPNGTKVNIIGVIYNYKQAGAWEKSQPTVIHYPMDSDFKFLALRGRSLADLKEVNEYCKQKWEELEPFMPYNSMYETNSLEGARETCKSYKQTFLTSAVLALFLSVGGLFSLVTMFVQRRTKEVAIRKSIGGGIKSILMLISKPYVIICCSAGLFGSFFGLYLVKSLLDDIYDYHMDVSVIWYFLASLLMLCVTILTISTRTIKAAVANPVVSLRYE